MFRKTHCPAVEQRAFAENKLLVPTDAMAKLEAIKRAL